MNQNEKIDLTITLKELLISVKDLRGDYIEAINVNQAMFSGRLIEQLDEMIMTISNLCKDLEQA